MRWADIISESLGDWNSSEWLHYSDHPTVSFNVRPSHQDPIAIYCFPSKFDKGNYWANKSYKFTITVSNTAKILDWPNINDNDLEQLLVGCKALEKFHYSLEQYPTDVRKEILKRAWNSMRDSMILGDGGGRAKWNKIFRELGYDALFDDTGSVHTAEVQLVIFNPKIITKVSRSSTAISGWAEMQKVVGDVEEMCRPYGEVTIEGPKKMRTGWGSLSPKILAATINVKKSEENYADFLIEYDTTESSRRDKISIGLRWSRPSLNRGAGATYNIHQKEYDKYGGLDRLKADLDQIFATKD